MTISELAEIYRGIQRRYGTQLCPDLRWICVLYGVPELEAELRQEVEAREIASKVARRLKGKSWTK